MRCPSLCPRSGFTLIELLVVPSLRRRLMSRRLLALLVLPCLLAAAPPPRKAATPKKGFLGVQIRKNSDKDPITVEGLFFGSPAHKAGLQRGDEIIAINGVRPATLRLAVRYIGG